jgi:hypothetical protein
MEEGKLVERKTMHLECLAHVGPVITCRLCLEDWTARRRTGRSGRRIWLFRGCCGRGHDPSVVTGRSGLVYMKMQKYMYKEVVENRCTPSGLG